MLTSSHLLCFLAFPLLCDSFAVYNRLALTTRRGSTVPRYSSQDGVDYEDEIISVRRISETEGRTMLEWPVIDKRSSFNDRYEGGEVIYVLEGSSTITVSKFLDGLESTRRTISAGDLLTVAQPCAIKWGINPPGITLLSKNYSEGGLFVVVATVTFFSFGLLLASVLSS